MNTQIQPVQSANIEHLVSTITLSEVSAAGAQAQVKHAEAAETISRMIAFD